MTFFYYLFLFSVLNFLNINTGYFFNKSKNSEYGEIFKNIIIGFCFIIIFTSFFYLVFNVDIQSILILLLLTNIFFLTKNLNKFLFFIKLLSKSLIPSLFFIIIFSLISFFYGEQYYSFRGNHWDYFNYITSALAISEYNLSYIETSIEELNNLYPFKGMGWLIHIEIRPSINIFYSLFFKIGLNNFYLVCFVLKTYGLFLIFSSSYIFLEKFPLETSLITKIIINTKGAIKADAAINPIIFFELIKSTTSYENVENVVKDPSKPITKKYLINSNEMFFIYPMDIKYPIKNEPIIFIISVE